MSSKKQVNGKQLPNELLYKVYDAAVAEYRFNVQLSWDRTKFFLLLNSALIAAGIGFFKISTDKAFLSLLLGCFFLISMFVAAMGLASLRVGKDYYRESIRVKTLVEHQLGLLNPISEFEETLGNKASLSIAVTSSQLDPTAILETAEAARDNRGRTILRSDTISGHTARIFYAMIVIEVICALVAFGQLFGLISPI